MGMWKPHQDKRRAMRAVLDGGDAADAAEGVPGRSRQHSQPKLGLRLQWRRKKRRSLQPHLRRKTLRGPKHPREPLCWQ